MVKSKEVPPPINGAQNKEYRWSETLQRHVSLGFLKVNEQVVAAAKSLEINDLHWNEAGEIDQINLPDAQKLTRAMGGEMMTARDYWLLYQESIRNGDCELQRALESDETEWLNTVYLKDQEGRIWMVEKPEFRQKDGKLVVSGEKKEISIPAGRPGWFFPIDPESGQTNIDPKTGFPKKVHRLRIKGTQTEKASWKYWAVEQINQWIGTVRSSVISSVTPAMDNDLPIGAKIKANKIRIVRETLPEPPINPDLLNQAQSLIKMYDRTLAAKTGTQNKEAHEEFYTQREEILRFVEAHGKIFVETQAVETQQIKERIIDMLGIIRIMARETKDWSTLEKVNLVTEMLFGIRRKINTEELVEFAETSKKRLAEALAKNKKIIFVMGHKNPDADTAVSSLLEAYRRQILDPETAYITVIQADKIPPEINFLLGDRIAGALIKQKDKTYQKAKVSGLARWVLTDHNVSEIQRFVEAIVDHHFLSPTAKKMTLPLSWEMLGSSTAMIWQKLQGMGLDLDQSLNQMVYGATLLDTENRDRYKMTTRDQIIMGQVEKDSGVANTKRFYQELMSLMLSEKTARILFERDYKEDWFLTGFAVAKVKGVFDARGTVLEPKLLEELVELAKKNNEKKNFAVTLIKVVDYENNNERVNRERIYLVFNKNTLPASSKFLHEYLERIIRFRFAHQPGFQLEHQNDHIDFFGTGNQLSRKVTAPYLEKAVEAFNRFFYCERNNLWFSRKLLEDSPEASNAAAKLGIVYSTDKKRVVNLNYQEAVALTAALGGRMPSLAEWWQMYNQAIGNNDQQMQENLGQLDICEATRTIVVIDQNGGQFLVNDPEEVQITAGRINVRGKRFPANIHEAKPGLAFPKDFDEATGLPKEVFPANFQEKQEGMIRFWSPRDPVSWAAITSINLNRNRAVDLRINPEEAFKKLGLRLCVDQVAPPKLTIYETKEGVFFKEKT